MLAIFGMRARQSTIYKAAILVLAAVVVFSPAFHGEWLWDDAAELAQNPDVVGTGGLAQIWFNPQHNDYFPLKATVQWLAWRIWGENVAGYHGLNILLHALSALLLWRVLLKLGVPAAWFGALVFAVHPLTVESVAWIAELKNTLSLPPLLLAMSAYIDFTERGRRRDYGLAVGWFLASLLCKTSGVMFPVVLLLYHAWRSGAIGWAALVRTVPFFGISLVLGLVTLHFQHERALSGWAVPIGGLAERTAVAGIASVFYAYKFLVPFNLVPVYPQWEVTGRSVVEFVPWVFWLGVLAVSWRARQTWGRHVIFGFGSYLALVAPVLGFVGMSYMRYSWVADHFVYLPMIPLVALAAGGVGWARRSLDRRPVRWTSVAAAAAVLALGLATWRYAAVFRGPEPLWRYTLEYNPRAWFAHEQLGIALHQGGKHREAEAAFQTALAAKPESPELRNNYGTLLLDAGRYAEAIEQFETALRLNPAFAVAHSNRGNTLLRLGRAEEAVAAFREAVRADPGLVQARTNLGNALYATGRTADAIAELRQAAATVPRYADAFDSLGTVLIRTGEPDEAVKSYARAVQLAPNHAGFRSNLGYALIVAGRFEEAAVHLREAVRLAPNHADAHLNLGGVLYQLGRVGDAIVHFEAALRVRPDLEEARQNLQLLRAQSNPVPAGPR
jgi:protein O-mannosyl-transferase